MNSTLQENETFRYAWWFAALFLICALFDRVGPVALVPGLMLCAAGRWLEIYLHEWSWRVWAAKQVRPIIVRQASPEDIAAHEEAANVRRLLIASGNENLVKRDAQGRVLRVSVHEVYFQDEPQVLETWEQYDARCRTLQAEVWAGKLREYKELNMLWTIEQWYKQKNVVFGQPVSVLSQPKPAAR
jgi:hypothetical protein